MKTAALSIMVLCLEAMTMPCIGQVIDDKGIFMRQKSSMKMVLHRPDTISIVFLGDMMLHSRQLQCASEKFMDTTHGKPENEHYAYDFSLFLSEIKDDITNADIAVANMEYTLGGPPFTGYPSFSAPDSYAEYMAECGIDVFLTANNHIFDKGRQGAIRTLEKYAGMNGKFGIRHTGTSLDSAYYYTSNPLIIDIHGIKTAFVNFTYGTNMSFREEYPKVNRAQKSQLEYLMQKAHASDADLIIALPHWGEEYSLHHSQGQYELAAWLAEQGADIIIGSHPHVVQDSTAIRVQHGPYAGKNVPVFFSLGNAISNMSAPDTQIGLMAEVNAVKLINGTVKILPVKLTYLWCSLPGRLKETHCTIPVRKYITEYNLWQMPYEYDKMVKTYHNVKSETRINDYIH